MALEVAVIIVGAGPAGLATSACLNELSIPNIILEKEDCHASLWKKRAYDRVHLHLAKPFCQLPMMPHADTTPNFMPKNTFIEYLDTYVSKFNIKPLYNICVESAIYDGVEKKWKIKAKCLLSNGNHDIKVYSAEFLVVATGENGESFIPDLPGLCSFQGEILHAGKYKSGLRYKDKEVLVVGCGNSGMEIAYDLANHGAHASIVARNPFHVLTKEMVYVGMRLLKYINPTIVDALITLWTKISYGDLSRYGIHRPTRGPFTFKVITGKTPVIDVGTITKIRKGEIQVLPEIKRVNGNNVTFENGVEQYFDVILFATGYKSVANKWLKDYCYILNDDGMPKNKFPAHWKGDHGLYCAGLSKMGLAGISSDARNIADDIRFVVSENNKLA